MSMLCVQHDDHKYFCSVIKETDWQVFTSVKHTRVHHRLLLASQSSITLHCYLISGKNLETDIVSCQIVRWRHLSNKNGCFETLQLPSIKSWSQRNIDFPLITPPLFWFPQHNLRPIAASVLISNISWLPSAKNILTPTYLLTKREE